jgi:predicted DNA-binding transcriptional regulator YafY
MGVSPSERIVNLALYLASARRPVSAREIAGGVAGYPSGQNDAAFGRMFERDKDELRHAGFVIDVDRSDEVERYRFDADATFSEPVELGPVETVELRAAAAAMLSDPSFPYPDDLRIALAKLTAAAEGRIGASSAVRSALNADEDPSAQGAAVAELTRAIGSHKRASFSYTGAEGKASQRTVEPWGLFARDGRWYLVARDSVADGIRVFAITRMADLSVAQSRPKTPDFAPPADFDVRRWMLMPFQYGAQTGEATLRLTGPAAHRASALVAGQGFLSAAADGAYLWRVPFADEMLLARWVAANGPGIEVSSPDSLRDALVSGLRKVVEQHA